MIQAVLIVLVVVGMIEVLLGFAIISLSMGILSLLVLYIWF